MVDRLGSAGGRKGSGEGEELVVLDTIDLSPHELDPE